MYTFDQLQSNFPLATKQIVEGSRRIKHLSIDSRTMVFPGETLFFALQGSRKDGHEYVRHAYDLGCRSFVVSRRDVPHRIHNANFLIVDSVEETLQQIAKKHRQQFHFPMIGLTGSNGKTWVKEWLYSICQDTFQVVRSPGSFNSQIGVPLSLWNLASQHTLGLIEAGISRVGEMELLADLIQPDIGVFTWIGDAHWEGFQSIEQKLNEKLNLFTYCQTILFSEDQPIVAAAIRKRFSEAQLLSWSTKTDATLKCDQIRSFRDETILTCSYQNEKFEIVIPFADEISIQNCLHCILVAIHLKIPIKTIQSRMKMLQPMHMRLEIVEAQNQCILINDSYSFDLVSLRLALQKMDVIDALKKKTVILSDLPTHDESRYLEIQSLMDSFDLHRIFVVGHRLKRYLTGAKTHTSISYFPNTTALLEEFQSTTFDQEIILVKGARKFQFERIAQFLMEKNHTVSLHIDFNSMLHNLQYFSKQLRPNTKLLAVIKASAYGSGSLEIARFLEFFKLDYLAVALIDEGVTLRKGGVTLPIIVLNPDSSELADLFDYQLEPEVYSSRILNQITAQAIKHQKKIKIHLKINTGMNRLGFDLSDLSMLIDHFLENAEWLEIQSIFSHLSHSEAAESDEFTNEQFKVFDKAYSTLTKALNVRPDRHILNTSGILRFPDRHFEMVRLGLGLYGIGMNEHNAYLRPVHSLKARIIQVRNIPQGSTVGYSRAYITDRPMKIATINIGYADGLPRQIGNEKYAVQIGGRFAPIIGNVCMDMLMCDITEVSSAKEGDDVIIFDEHRSVEEMSQVIHTIPYEILSQIAPRVQRIFHYT